ncbi:MAG TPA: preprotein translocase subunit YajC [Syntrophomonadaceae bacterium]|nr:preprotein translocase subunit YajC [Syntrophomonadaceae bacterium]HQE22661.1 preprotein translocase subunit YajC [Syntrophomonadaceae bacterium]
MQNQWIQLAIWFVLFIGIFYVFIIMPRKKQEKKHQEMVSALKRGEKVVTIGGIKGEIAKVKEETVMLKVSDNVEIEMLKKAIAYKDGEQ